MRKVLIYVSVSLLAVILLAVTALGIYGSCFDDEVIYDEVVYDDGKKNVVVESCDLIGAGGYGALYDISIDPFNDSIFAVRCDMGGLYMSYNKGKSWERRNILGVMSDIDFDEENEGVVWASGSGLYKSSDHGKTFELVFPSKESIITHGSGGENMGECIYTDNPDYEPSSGISSIAMNRKSQGKNIFVAQKLDYPSDGSSKSIRVFETKNGKDFNKFIDLPYTGCIKLEFDEARDCLVVVSESSIAEYSIESKKKVWSAEFNLSTFVNGIIAFDSYYDRDSGKNTFAFCELKDANKKIEKDTCFFTDNLQQDKTQYQDLNSLLYQKKLKDIKDKVDEGQEEYAANEYYYWLKETQFFDWRITNVHIARENVFYFYHTCTDRLIEDGKETGGEVYINAYLQYKDGNFKWIYGTGVSHAGVEDLSNENWVDWASFGPAFGFASSRQNEDMVAISTMGTVYYTEDCKTVSQCHCTLGATVEVTAKDNNGHEEKVSKLEWGIPIHETTTSGIDVQTTYKTVTDPFNKDHLLMACTDIGLIQSFNGGKTWIHSLLSWSDGKTEPMSSYYRNTCYDIEFDKEREGVVYAIWSGTHDAPYFPTTDYLRATGAFAISYDGGTSWTMKQIRKDDNVLPYRMDIDYTKKGRRIIYIATESHGFFVTKDLGESFEEMNDGIRVSTYLGKDNPAIFGNEILSCKAGIYAITGPSAWGRIPNPENPDEMIYEKALYKWNERKEKFEEIKLPNEIAAVRDIEYSDKEDCLYIGAIGSTAWDTNKKCNGGLYRYKDGEFTQIFDDSKFVWGLGLDSNCYLYAVTHRGEIYRFTENNTKPVLLIGKEDYVGELYHILKDISFGETDNIFYISTFGGGMYRITLKEASASLAFQSEYYDTGAGKQLQLGITSQNTRDIEYRSSDESIATVGATGTVTPVKVGQVTITATAKSNDGADTVLSDSCTVYVNPSEYSALDGKERCIHWTGRNFTFNGAVNCYNTASGFETVFYGTELNVTATSSGGNTPQLVVLIDNESDFNARKIDLTKTLTTDTYKLIGGLEEGRHTARVYKITEATVSMVAFSGMSTDGYFMTPPPPKSLKMEVYGDSITAGLTILWDKAEEPYGVDTDKMQNGCLTYAWRAAQNLNAEINVMAMSGVGLDWSHGSPFLMKDNWTKTFMAQFDYLHWPSCENADWDFTSYVPDVVLINLGTNDTWNTSGYDAATYENSLRAMATGLIEKYGTKTKIVLLYGMMTDKNADEVNRVAETLSNQGYAVSAKRLSGNSWGHPRVSHNEKAGEELTQYLQTLLSLK